MDNILTKPVIRLDTDEHSINWKWQDGGNKINPNLQIASIDEFNNWVKEGDNASLVPANCICGDVLVENPFRKGCYLKIEQLEDEVCKHKGFFLSEIARLLGCKEFSWDIDVVEVCERTLDSNGHIGIKTFTGDGSYKKEVEEAYRSKFHFNRSYTSGACSVADYDEAQQVAKEYGMWQNSDVFTLIKGRNPQSSNLISEQTIRISLCDELNESSDIAFSLKFLKFVDINGKINTTITSKKEATLICTMKF